MFDEDETLSFIFDEYVNVETPKMMKNPYLIARCTNPTSFKLDRTSGYILHLQKQEFLNSTLTNLSLSNFWIDKQSPNSRFLVIINDKTQDLRNIFTTFWNLKIHKVMVLTQRQDRNQTSVQIHTSNPFYKENLCGSYANIIDSQDFTVLTSPQYAPGITNIEQLIESHLPILAHSAIKSTVFEHEENLNTLYSKIKNQMLYRDLEHNELAKELNSNNYAFFTVELDFKFLQNEIGGNIHVNCIDVNVIIGDLRSSFVLASGHFFTKTLNSFIRAMDESEEDFVPLITFISTQAVDGSENTNTDDKSRGTQNENAAIAEFEIQEPAAVSFSDLLAFPGPSGVSTVKKHQYNRKQHSEIFTSTPMKAVLDEKEEKKIQF
ncbi:hypothetical protein RN001_011682 [Aquatica leii]|uniref:Uncharacterized protein n=1 Tax=Aquatica leii TaxID=1421715 RepID=A0AAN7NXM9_9COLE|nr:hypothetical protein RN001_011682 [Aquatica leii]